MRLIRRFFSHHRLPVVFMCLLCGICSTYHLNQASAVFNLQKSVLDEDQALKNAESTFSAELKSAEMVYVAMRQKASAKRLSVYREKLKSFTKAGDFDKAVACKSAIESIEASGIEGSYPRPKDVVKYDGHRYGLVKEAATWHVAKKRCEMMGGHLVTLDSKGEIEWLENFCRMNKTTCWIGATDEEVEGEWRWLDGRKVADSFMKTVVIDNTYQSEHWLVFAIIDGRWHDTSHRYPYVCEWDD